MYIHMYVCARISYYCACIVYCVLFFRRLLPHAWPIWTMEWYSWDRILVTLSLWRQVNNFINNPCSAHVKRSKSAFHVPGSMWHSLLPSWLRDIISAVVAAHERPDHCHGFVLTALIVIEGNASVLHAHFNSELFESLHYPTVPTVLVLSHHKCVHDWDHKMPVIAHIHNSHLLYTTYMYIRALKYWQPSLWVTLMLGTDILSVVFLFHKCNMENNVVGL